VLRILLAALLGVAAIPETPHAPPTVPRPDTTERIATLGRVWGFLKYFHPAVAGGGIDWDSVLVAVAPHVQAARSPADHAAALQALLDAAGPARPCTACPATYPDSALHNLDLVWIDDAARVPPVIAAALHDVRRNRHVGAGRYVRFAIVANFEHDTSHEAPDLPAPEVRLLALFRYWNAVKYYFPYLYVNDGDWNDVLAEFVPRMLDAPDVAAYHLAVLELTARVRDTHVTTRSPVIDRLLGDRMPPFAARSVEGHIVVTRAPPAGAGDLQVGDVITHIDGEAVAARRERLRRFVAAGNTATLERKLVTLLLRDSVERVSYDVLRGGVPAQAEARFTSGLGPMPGTTRPETSQHSLAELITMLPDSIAVVDMGNIEVAQVDSASARLRAARGIVLDVRNYPRGTLHAFTALLSARQDRFVTFTGPDSTHPGVFGWGPVLATGPRDQGAEGYAGRVAILVDERTQSHAEFTTMALQTIQRSRVFGSQTAGADGNITYLALPGGITTIFTGLGVYYPDGRPTQRIGIVPDIEVKPTLAAFLEGRDEVMERALEYVRNTQQH
jgi:carboxyl-terminal processing protease